MAGGLGDILGLTNSAQGLLGMLPGPARAVQYSQNTIMPNAIPDPVTIINMYMAGYIDTNYFHMMMRMNGFDDSMADNMSLLAVSRLPVTDLVNLWRRGKVSKKFLDYEFEKIGVTGYYKALYLEATQFFPSPPDLVRFAVREVYTPDIRKKFGMDEDLSKKFLQEAFKAGLPEEQARNFWASHWELPSVQMALEMFHREVIDKPELEMLLRAQDVMPFWRSKITDISYNLVTRVDARRMYGLGIWDEERLIKHYNHIGYSPDDSADLVLFTKRYENLEADGLTRASLIEAYVKNILSIDDLRDMLKKLNYVDSVVEFWVQNAVWDKTLKEIDILLADIKEQYFMGAIDRAEVQSLLQNADLPTALIQTELTALDTEKAKKRKVPPKTDLDDWLDAGVITEEYYIQHMRLLGYVDKDIQMYLSVKLISRKTFERKFLTADDYLRWFKAGLMKRDQLTETLIAMKYSDEDITIMLTEVSDNG